MTYGLDLFFKPAVTLSRISQYFLDCKYFRVIGNEVFYENPDTQVSFFFHLRFGRSLLLKRTVVAAEFEVNYGRPSWFGDEAQIELSAFMAALRPRIEDAQMRGMVWAPIQATAS